MKLISFPETLKKGRKKCGLTQVELAERLKLHQAYVAQVEGGKRIPKEELLRRWASVLNLNIDELAKLVERARNHPKSADLNIQSHSKTGITMYLDRDQLVKELSHEIAQTASPLESADFEIAWNVFIPELTKMKFLPEDKWLITSTNKKSSGAHSGFVGGESLLLPKIFLTVWAVLSSLFNKGNPDYKDMETAIERYAQKFNVPYRIAKQIENKIAERLLF